MAIGCSKVNKPDLLSGTYKVTGEGINLIGTWVFSKDEITMLENDVDKNPFESLAMIAVQKYYIEDDVIYQCLCNTNNCLEKASFEKFWQIDSIVQTETQQIILLKPTSNDNFKIRLTKDKSIGLNVKIFHSENEVEEIIE